MLCAARVHAFSLDAALANGRAGRVTHRETPVARLEPVAPGPAPLAVRRPAPDAPKPKDVALPPPLTLRNDILHLLADERGER